MPSICIDTEGWIKICMCLFDRDKIKDTLKINFISIKEISNNERSIFENELYISDMEFKVND